MFSPGGVQHKWLLTLANLLMWGIPQHYNTLLDEMYVNEQVYADQWTQLVSKFSGRLDKRFVMCTPIYLT